MNPETGFWILTILGRNKRVYSLLVQVKITSVLWCMCCY